MARHTLKAGFKFFLLLTSLWVADGFSADAQEESAQVGFTKESGDRDNDDKCCKRNGEVAQGREIWFKSTFGGERFFSLILPNPPFNLALGFDKMLTWPRASRFSEFGVINDPGCTPGDASTGYLDRCKDPESAGVVGVRKFPNPSGGKPLIGLACASCHAGFDPSNPPANPNDPQWDSIHPTIGNQHLDTAKIFKANLSPHDPRYQVFSSWAPGTVDTTAI